MGDDLNKPAKSWQVIFWGCLACAFATDRPIAFVAFLGLAIVTIALSIAAHGEGG